MVKVFPAVTASYIKEVLGPLNYISLAPTGGIGLENFTSFFAAGAKAVGIGSHLFPKQIIESEDWLELGNVYNAYVEKYRQHLVTP